MGKLAEKESDDKANSKLQYGAAAMQGWRASMEDAHSAHIELEAEPNIAFFGVYDGHGGAEVAHYCQQNLHTAFIQTDSFARGDYKQALRDSFLQMDVQMFSDEGRRELAEYDSNVSLSDADFKGKLKQQGTLVGGLGDIGNTSEFSSGSNDADTQAGTTCVVGVVAENTLYCANAGDSRGVLCRQGQAIEMSEDHKPVNEKERQRIQNAGGFVQDGRVNGSLALSRAIGDVEFKQTKQLDAKNQIVTAEPDVRTFTLQPTDEFFMLACDGIWDVLGNQEAIDFTRSQLQQGKNPKDIAEELCDRCLASNTSGNGAGCDNMTVLIVCFRRP